MKHKLHRHVKLEIQKDLPLNQVIVDEEFKPLFEWYQEIPDIPNHIIVTQEEYYLNKNN